MDDNEFGVQGRDKEIKCIKDFITSTIDTHESGILYLAGAPGTGKTMSIQLVLNQIKGIPKMNFNCMKAQSSKSLLMSICRNVGLQKLHRCNEVQLMSMLEAVLSGDKAHILVFDEMDQLPKSKNVNLIKTIFSWPLRSSSRLILVGIANTLNLTSRYQVINEIVGDRYHNNSKCIKKILFRPYSTKDIKSILMWYLDNDENYEDTDVDSKALDMIASKYSREKNGDIRGALNALKCAIDDTIRQRDKKQSLRSPTPETIAHLPTPPATPTLTPVSSPCKEKTNIAMVANSIKKRSKRTLYEEDTIPLTHQIIATCILRLSQKNSSIDSRICKNMTLKVLKEFGSGVIPDDDYRQVLTYLETQGILFLKKIGPRERILLRVSGTEMCDLIPEMDRISSVIDKNCP